MLKYKSITGTKDIIPPESSYLTEVENTIREVFELYSYEEIRTPIFEETGLFLRSIGENTDIVGKEMYTFLDKGGTSLTLRPELTASVLRAYVQHNLSEQSMLSKFYYLGPVFRQERPQAGRLRQFHQFGAEALGSQNPIIDAEMISLAADIYYRFNIFDFDLKINSIGCNNCRKDYKQILFNELVKIKDNLSKESQNRLYTNPFRILDSKDIKDKEATENAPLLLDHLCDECKDHFEKVKSNLDLLKIKYIVDGRIVRGLDYYTKTAFEFIGKHLGSQDALAGGGRYDNLVEEIGGKPTPGIGFAAGIERLLLVLEKVKKESVEDLEKIIYITVVDEVSRKEALVLARELRKNRIKTDLDFHYRSVKAQFREANKKRSRYVIVLSESELKENKVTLKDMSNGEQEQVELQNLIKRINF